MDQRIKSFLADILALAGEAPDAVRKGVRVALADCEAIFRAQEANKRMRDNAARVSRALCRTRVVAEMYQRPRNADRRALEAGAQHSSTGRCSKGAILANLLDRARGELMIIAPGEKVFGALLAIAGAVIIFTGHWATTDDMIADLIAGLLMLAFGVTVLLMWSFQR